MEFTKFTLDNGLTVLFHRDKNTPIVSTNLIYKVGSKHENPDKTGYAHLLEHLMFEGSINVPDFDTALEKAGGTNNAFTNNDYTNYYIILPKNNIETALWLESDRMLGLAFDPERFNVQKKVVVEEFMQTSLNEPYGDDMALIAELAYTKHPYQWQTIGKDPKHIENATIDDVRDFYLKHYAPNNAILSIAGDFEPNQIKDLVNKWFGDIPKRKLDIKKLPEEPPQTQRREKSVKRNVPYDTLYMAFHKNGRLSRDYYITDVITDILDDGESSRLYQNLVKKNHIFEDIDAFITGNIDNGLVIFSGKPANGLSIVEAEKYFWDEINKLKTNFVTDNELQKTINSLEFSIGIIKTNLPAKTRLLGYYEMLGDTNLINKEQQIYNSITKQEIKDTANKIFDKNNVSVLYYYADK